MLHLRQWATNHAPRIQWMATRHHARHTSQRPQLGLRVGQRMHDGVYYQRVAEGILICWRAPGFADGESGINCLEGSWRVVWVRRKRQTPHLHALKTPCPLVGYPRT